MFFPLHIFLSLLLATGLLFPACSSQIPGSNLDENQDEEQIQENQDENSFEDEETGDLQEGISFTTQRSEGGFGSQGPTLIVLDSFEQGSNGDPVVSPDVGAYGYAEAFYSSNAPKVGQLSACSFPTSSDQYKVLEVEANIESGKWLYFSAWLRSTGGVGGQKKIFELWGSPYTGNYAPGFGSADGYSYIAREDSSYFLQTYYPSGSVDQSGGTWQYWEIIAHMNSSGGVEDGSLKISVDDIAIFQHENINVRRDTERIWGSLYWMDGHTNPSDDEYVVYCTDEIYASRGVQRVVLAASSNPEDIRRVPQQIESWSDQSITYLPRRGALESDTVFELVYDASNTLVKTTERHF